MINNSEPDNSRNEKKQFKHTLEMKTTPKTTMLDSNIPKANPAV